MCIRDSAHSSPTIHSVLPPLPLQAGSVDTLVTLDLSFLGTLLRTGKPPPFWRLTPW